MADYSMVKDQSGDVCGLWLRDSRAASDAQLLAALLIKHDLPDELGVAVMTGSYRVVANTVDDAGGCFVMIGSTPTSREKSAQRKKWWQFWR